MRMAREVVLFESLFKSNKWIWLFGWLFHVGLALVLLRHIRYFQEPVWFWVEFIQPFGKYASFHDGRRSGRPVGAAFSG
jgi:nitrate reductase gamma subunit